MTTAEKLLYQLLDGHFHSGEKLGKMLGMSRSAVWKGLQLLRSWGLQVHSVRGRGYRLAQAMDLLQAADIRRELRPKSRNVLQGLEVLLQVDSTNRYLRKSETISHTGVIACFAESQTQGRGRRGRHWHSPFGCNIYLSLMLPLKVPVEALGGLSLAVGVAMVHSLESLGFAGVGLKWPNDLYWQQRKLAGILIEIEGESAGPSRVIIGVGLNVDMQGRDVQVIDQPWTDLRAVAQGLGLPLPSRNQLAGRLLADLIEGLSEFETHGFAAVRNDWERRDVSRGQRVTIKLPSEMLEGVGRGVDEGGAFLLERKGEIHAIYSGEVSLQV